MPLWCVENIRRPLYSVLKRLTAELKTKINQSWFWTQYCNASFPKVRELSAKVTKFPSPLDLSSFGISISFLTPRGIAGVSSLTLVNSAVLSRASPVLDGTRQSALSSPGLLSLLPLYVEMYSLEGQPGVDVTAPAKGSAQFPPRGSETKQPWRVLPRPCAGSQEQMNSRCE